MQVNAPSGQSLMIAHCLQVLFTQTGADADVHVPHEYVPLQPSGAVPQLLPEQAVGKGVLVQPQTFGVPVPWQVWGDVHVPHV